LTLEEEALLGLFRKHTRLALDDCLEALQPTMPHLPRSSLQRCVPRHDRSRLPEIEGDQPAQKRLKPSPIGSFHIAMAAVSTAEGQLRRLVAIDRSSTYAYAKLHTEATKIVAAPCLRHLIAAVPDKLHTGLTDNGIPLTTRSRAQDAFRHLCERVCSEQGIEHRLTKVKHPWTNGHVARLNRTRQEATVKTYHDQPPPHLKEPLHALQMAYTFATRLNTLKGLTPYEYRCPCWPKEPERFSVTPCHHTVGLNT
jgi:transposase InsO family protein